MSNSIDMSDDEIANLFGNVPKEEFALTPIEKPQHRHGRERSQSRETQCDPEDLIQRKVEGGKVSNGLAQTQVENDGE